MRSTYNPILLSQRLKITFEEAEKIVAERKKNSSTSLSSMISKYGEEEGKRRYIAMIEKRKLHSPYDAESVSNREGITLEEARQVVAERKSRTAGTLENFIKRHGEEEGLQRYSEFCRKSANTKEKFILKYGPIEGLIEWEKYKKTKESRSVGYFKKKFGENWETQRDEFIHSWKRKVSLEGFKEKYGDQEGERLYLEMNSKKANTLSKFIEKYGEERGRIEWEDYNLAKDSSSLHYHISKFGEAEGLEKFKERNMRRSPIFAELKRRYTDEIAVGKYQEYLDGKNSEELEQIKKCIFSPVKHKDYRRTKGSVSKAANTFFALLSELVDHDLIFGSKKVELSLFDEEVNKKFYYDCVVPYIKTVIEFNGAAFHCREDDPDNWVSPYGMTKGESVENDRQKINCANRYGYDVIVVWENDIRTKRLLKEKLQEIANEIRRKGMV